MSMLLLDKIAGYSIQVITKLICPTCEVNTATPLGTMAHEGHCWLSLYTEPCVVIGWCTTELAWKLFDTNSFMCTNTIQLRYFNFIITPTDQHLLKWSYNLNWASQLETRLEVRYLSITYL